MQTLAWLARLVTDALTRRRTRWIEVSVTRAWSHDMHPRLFDLGD
jgi:hypothetical protein